MVRRNEIREGEIAVTPPPHGFTRGNFALSKVRAFVDFVREETRDEDGPGSGALLGLATAI